MMGIFTDWTSVSDSYGLEANQAVRCPITYGAIPFFGPGADDWSAHIEAQSRLLVERVEYGVGSGVLVYGYPRSALSVGELRAQLRAAVVSLNDARSVPIYQIVVGSPQVEDSRAPGGGGWLSDPAVSLAGLSFGAVLALAVIAAAGYFIFLRR